MAKLSLADISSGYLSAALFNANNTLIEEALENTLSRDGTSPNTMEANLDMNSYRITNLPDASNNQDPITLSQAASIVGVEEPLSQENVGDVLYPQSTDETNDGLTVLNTNYQYGDYRRFTNDLPDSNNSIKFSVGATGTFDNLNDAIRHLWRKPPTDVDYIELEYETGEVMAEQLFLVGRDYSHLRITSVDSQVTVTQSAITTQASSLNDTPTGNLPNRYPVFFGYHANLPVIGVQYVMDDSGGDNAYVGFLLHQSDVTGLDGCGMRDVDNASETSRGLNATHGSEVAWWGADFQGCDIGARISNSSVASLRDSNFTECGTAGVDVGSAHASVQDSDFSGCVKQGLVVGGNGTAHADSIIGSTAGAASTACGAGGTSADYSLIRATGSAKVNAPNIDADGCGRGITIEDDAEVSGIDGSFDGTQAYAVFNDGGEFNGSGMTSDGAAAGLAVDAVRTRRGGRSNLRGATIENVANSGSAIVSDDSETWAFDVTLTGNTRDFEAVGGGVIHADPETLVNTSTSVSRELPVSQIDSSSGAVTGTLGSATKIGFIKTIVMTDATNSSTVSVTNHATSDPEVFTFSAVDDTLVLLWNGTEWITLSTSGVTT